MKNLTMFFDERMGMFEFWIRKIVEHFKQSLMGHNSNNIKDSTEGNLNYSSSSQKVSE